jgi:hypothetical protein
MAVIPDCVKISMRTVTKGRTMTFLKTQYRLARAVTLREWERLNRLCTVYGVRGLAVDGEVLSVDYDASRIHEAAVLAAVRATGFPAEPLRPMPPGAFDYTGEFHDFAWSTSGLSSVNRNPAQK